MSEKGAPNVLCLLPHRERLIDGHSPEFGKDHVIGVGVWIVKALGKSNSKFGDS
jgi:hypothetical protein